MHAVQAFLLTQAACTVLVRALSMPGDLSAELRWNYTLLNPKCVTPGGRNPCQDIRICNFAVASLGLGGWPTYCGWVNDAIPKVCCGLPLVLGKKLMDRVEEEKARARECGRRTMSLRLSPTENKFFDILQSLPPVDNRMQNKYDPPLDLTMEVMTSSISSSSMSTQDDFPWMVAILKDSKLLCGGVLIDRIHVLTSAHCFAQDGQIPDASRYIVHVGSINSDLGVPYVVQKLKVHEDYRADQRYHDIAILTLEQEILFWKIPSICLPDDEMTSMDMIGANSTLLLWKSPDPGQRPFPTLQIVDQLTVLPNTECDQDYRQVDCQTVPDIINSTFICTKYPENTVENCQPYSVGPLMYKYNYDNLPDYDSSIPWVLIGLVSFGPMCGESGHPGVFTRVSSYMDWIKENAP